MVEKQASSEIAQSRAYERCPDCDQPLEPCGSCPQCDEYPDSPCHKAYFAWDGWKGPAPMWDTFRAGWQAAERDTRERCAQIAREHKKMVGLDSRTCERIASSIEARGKE